MSGASDDSFLGNVGPGGVPAFGGWNGGTDMGKNSLSYRDILLSLRDSGFLEKNGLEEEALQGWRNYFSKMSEKNHS